MCIRFSETVNHSRKSQRCCCEIKERAARVALMKMQAEATAPARVAVVTTWGGTIKGLRRDLVPWMQLMTELGVRRFYVRPCSRIAAPKN